MRRLIAALVAAAVLVVLLVPIGASAPPTAEKRSEGISSKPAAPAWKKRGCGQPYTRGNTRRAFRKAFDGRRKATPHERRTLKRVIHCQRHAGVRQDLRAKRIRARTRHLSRRRAYEAQNYWRLQWAALSSGDRAWAVSTGECESGNDPGTNTGNGYHGEHQWLISTWQAAGGSGSPVDASQYEQRVRAVRWRNVAGVGQWPRCG